LYTDSSFLGMTKAEPLPSMIWDSTQNSWRV
jgi:hypothetical protein